MLPTFTAVIAFASLGETLSAGEIIGGGGLSVVHNILALTRCAAVSLCGVVLIAQPAFIFGRYGHVAANSTPAERLWAVGYVLDLQSVNDLTFNLRSGFL